jgi:hypothetical protein
MGCRRGNVHVYREHRPGVSYRKIGDFLATYADLHVALDTFVRAEQRLADLAPPTRVPSVHGKLVWQNPVKNRAPPVQ